MATENAIGGDDIFFYIEWVWIYITDEKREKALVCRLC